jgi:hypothetical protein
MEEEIVIKSVKIKKYLGKVACSSSHHSGEISSTFAYTAEIKCEQEPYLGISKEDYLQEYPNGVHTYYVDGIITHRNEQMECGWDCEDVCEEDVITAIIIEISVKAGSFTTVIEVGNEEIKQDILEQIKELGRGDK